MFFSVLAAVIATITWVCILQDLFPTKTRALSATAHATVCQLHQCKQYSCNLHSKDHEHLWVTQGI